MYKENPGLLLSCKSPKFRMPKQTSHQENRLILRRPFLRYLISFTHALIRNASSKLWQCRWLGLKFRYRAVSLFSTIWSDQGYVVHELQSPIRVHPKTHACACHCTTFYTELWHQEGCITANFRDLTTIYFVHSITINIVSQLRCLSLLSICDVPLHVCNKLVCKRWKDYIH